MGGRCAPPSRASGENRARLPAVPNRRIGYALDLSAGIVAGQRTDTLMREEGGVPRLIIVSFLFMALAFYQLSGGADFVPRGVRPPKPEPQVAKAKPKPALPVAQPVLAPRRFRQTGPGTDPEEISQARRIAALKAQQAERAARLAQLRSGLDTGLSGGLGFAAGADGGTPASGGIALSALAQGVAGLREAAPEPAPEPAAVAAPPPPPPDIREVTGTHVNMRDGPGTIYTVVARLTLGHKVEVLDASGTGWLRLRSLPEQQIGWVAASLISKTAE